MRAFALPVRLLSSSPGFALFGPAHLGWLLLMGAAAALGLFAFCRGSSPARRRLLRGIAALLLLLELLRTLWLWRQGSWAVGDLPLHLCNFSTACLIWQVLRPSRAVGEILYALGLPGACAALLLPDWTAFPPMHGITAICFLSHMLLVLGVLCLLAAGEIVPSLRRLWVPALFLAVSAAGMHVINGWFSTNFFFLEWAPLGLREVERAWGLGGYRGVLALLVLGCWAILYLPLFWKKDEKKKSQS